VIDWIAGWDFALGSSGAVVSGTLIDLTGNGAACTVNGTPVGVGSPILH